MACNFLPWAVVKTTMAKALGRGGRRQKNASDGQKKKGNQDSEMEGSDMTETETEGMESPPAFPNTIFHPLKSAEFALQQLLHSVEPKYIILYDVNIATVREIEMYQATRAKEVLRVYFLMYEDSIDEQRYLTSLRREKDAFEFLIKEKSIMVIPEEQDGKGEYHPDLIDDLGKSNEPASSRKAGGAVAPVSTSRRVIVDLREFRSELPSLIHRRGINVQPVTIEVGDYILTPEICVERKSLNDLIGSLNNGRLYNQAQAMCRYYKRPVLLIEFNQNQPFCLQGKHLPSSESTSSQTFVSKLILLTMHFPRLRLLWCQSPYATAEIFDILKHGKEEPSVAEAQAVTEKELQDSGKSSDKYNPAPQDFLLHLPGVGLKNYTSLMRKFTCLADMFKASEEELSSAMGNAAQAKALWQAIHNPIEHNPQKAVAQRKFRKK
uniref:DNA repair endonuclease XPF n=1 Tax=Rhipicephalus zambeziensis TaxID=60191 RepID=A0A224YX84_9ACAR